MEEIMNTSSIKAKLDSIEQELVFVKKALKEHQPKSGENKSINDLCGTWKTDTSMDELESIQIQPRPAP